MQLACGRVLRPQLAENKPLALRQIPNNKRNGSGLPGFFFVQRLQVGEHITD